MQGSTLVRMENKIKTWSKPTGIHNLGKAPFLHPHSNHLAKPPCGNPSICCLHPYPGYWALWENHQCVEDAPAKLETTEARGDKLSILGSFWESSDLHPYFPDPFSQLFLFFSKSKIIHLCSESLLFLTPWGLVPSILFTLSCIFKGFYWI